MSCKLRFWEKGSALDELLVRGQRAVRDNRAQWLLARDGVNELHHAHESGEIFGGWGQALAR